MLAFIVLLAVGGLTLPVLPPEPMFPAVTAAPTPQASEPAGSIVGVNGPFVGLSLENALAMAVAKNTDVTVARENRRIARYQILAARGAYDLRFTVTPNYTYTQQPVTNPFFAGPNGLPVQQSTLSAGAALSGRTLAGGSYTLSASGSRTNDNTSINSFDPTYASAFSLDLRQPLLRGAGEDESKHALQVARAGSERSAQELLLSTSDALVSTANAYYDLTAAWRMVAVQEDALRQAEAQRESNQRMVAHGAAAPVDVAESDVQVEVFQSAVFSALQNVARLQNQLRRLTLADPSDPLWLADIVPSSPVSEVPAEPSLDDLLTAALRNRPEIGALRASRESAEADVAYARGQVKPQVDLHLGATENGFAGAPVNAATSPLAGFPAPPVPTYETGKLGQAWTNALAGRFPQYTLGATIGLPLANRTARADLAAARSTESSLDAQRVALIQRIVAEARNAVQGFRSARARLIAASAQRAAAERVLVGEQRRFAAGRSTTFFVLQRQVSVANARGNEVQARTDLQEAFVELDRVSGNIFTRYGVDVSRLEEGK